MDVGTTIDKKDRGAGVLAIHLGTDIGFCYDGRPGTWTFSKVNGRGYIGKALLDTLKDYKGVARILVTHCLDEAENHDTAVLMAGLSMLIETFGYTFAIPVELMALSDVHDGMFGADLSKRKIQQHIASLAKRRGLTKISDDAASALVLFEYGNRLRAAA